MADYTNTPNMNLQLPLVGVASGLQWELSINANASVLDSHNHAPGSGVQIGPLGLNINANLSFQNNQATNVFGVLFSAPAASSLTTFLYTKAQSGGGIYDLYFNDGAGNVIPITKAGIVNTIASSIPGESYSGGTFTWVQGAASTTPANFDIGSIVLRPNTAGTTNGITLSPPGAIASAYSLVLPALPGVTSIMALDSSGNITAPYTVDNATIVISGNVLGVPAGGIGTTQLAALSVTTAKIAAGAVTLAKLAAANESFSSTTGNAATSSLTLVDVTNATVTLTTTGRSVRITLMASPSAVNQGWIRATSSDNTNPPQGLISLLRDGTVIATYELSSIAQINASSALLAITIPASAFSYVDQAPSSGSHTYKLQYNVFNAAVSLGVHDCTLHAVEY